MAEEPNPLAASGEVEGGSIDKKGGENKELLKTLIPEGYHDRKYLEPILGMEVAPGIEALTKKLDESQKLIGKKIGIPAPDAPPEEWENFNKQLRPETADGYEFTVREGIEPDKEFMQGVKGVFHKAGLSKQMGKAVQEGFDNLIASRIEAQNEAQKADKEAFEKLVTDTFAEGGSEVLKRADEMLAEHCPEPLRPHLPKLDKETRAILAGVLNNVHAKYGSEDHIDHSGAGGDGDSTSLREQARKIMASPEYKDPFHPKYEELKKRVDGIYVQIGKTLGQKK